MGVFGVFFGCRGDAGFIGPLLWVSGGVVGFNVAMFPRPVRDVIRPALPGVWVRARKSSPSGTVVIVQARKSSPSTRKMAQNGCFMPSWGTSSRKCGWRGRAGRVISRKCGWRGRAGRVISRKCGWRGCVGRVLSRSSSGGIPPGEFVAPCAWHRGPSASTLNPSMRS